MVRLRRFLILLCLLNGPVLCADELALTGNVRRNQGVRVGFRVEPPSASRLFDGSLTDQNSLGLTQDSAIRVTFDESVKVTRVTISYYNDPARTYNAAQEATVRLLKGQGSLGAPVVVPIDGDAEVRVGTDDHLVLAGKAEARFDEEAPVTGVSLDVRKKESAHQACVREVEIWGLPVRMARMGWQPLAARVTDNTDSSMRVEWEDLPSTACYARVRFRKVGEKAWRSACFTAGRSPGLIMGLEPTTAYEVLVDARVATAKGAAPSSPIQSVRLPGPLEVRTVGDVFGMNFFPGGGGSHQARDDERAATLAMCKLMREAGVRHARWWVAGPGGAELFSENGMSLLANCGGDWTAESFARRATESGLFLYDTANEPDYRGEFAEEYVAELRKMRAAADRTPYKIALIGPTFGGDLEGPGSDYLEACYRFGLKGMLQALDLHPYCKDSTPTPPGGPLGGPEGVLNSLRRARKVLRRSGEDQLPITVSESGHPTHEGYWFVPPVTYAQQAMWVVRSHLLLVGSGVRRIWWYAFQDEGTDRRNPEHQLGIVDWHGKPKPAYEAYKLMIHLLAGARCEGLQSDARPPVYGVRFREGRSHVTALWDSGGESEIVISDKGSLCDLLDLFGRRASALLRRRDRDHCVLTLTESVVYLRSTSPLRVESQRRLTPPVEPQVQMTLTPSTVFCTPGETRSWTCHVKSEFGVPVEVRLTVPRPWSGQAEPRALTLAPGGTADVGMDLSAPLDARKQITSWDVQCSYRRAGTGEDWRNFRRAIFFQVEPNGGSKQL